MRAGRGCGGEWGANRPPPVADTGRRASGRGRNSAKRTASNEFRAPQQETHCPVDTKHFSFTLFAETQVSATPFCSFLLPLAALANALPHGLFHPMLLWPDKSIGRRRLNAPHWGAFTPLRHLLRKCYPRPPFVSFADISPAGGITPQGGLF